MDDNAGERWRKVVAVGVYVLGHINSLSIQAVKEGFLVNRVKNLIFTDSAFFIFGEFFTPVLINTTRRNDLNTNIGGAFHIGRF